MFLQADERVGDVVEEPLLESGHQIASDNPAKDGEKKPPLNSTVQEELNRNNPERIKITVLSVQ